MSSLLFKRQHVIIYKVGLIFLRKDKCGQHLITHVTEKVVRDFFGLASPKVCYILYSCKKLTCSIIDHKIENSTGAS